MSSISGDKVYISATIYEGTTFFHKTIQLDSIDDRASEIGKLILSKLLISASSFASRVAYLETQLISSVRELRRRKRDETIGTEANPLNAVIVKRFPRYPAT